MKTPRLTFIGALLALAITLAQGCKLLNASDEETAERHLHKARVFYIDSKLAEDSKFAKAEQHCRKAFDIYRDIALGNLRTYLPKMADALWVLALIHSDMNEYSKAVEYFETVLRLYRGLEREQFYIIATLRELAKLHRKFSDYPKALEALEKTLNIYRRFAEVSRSPGQYYRLMADTLNELASLHKNMSEYPKALEKHEEALKIYRDLTKEFPSEECYLLGMAETLNNLARLHKDMSEYPKALEKHEEALKIYKDLSEELPLPDTADRYERLIEETFQVDCLDKAAMTLNDLADVYKWMNDYPKAAEEYKEALKIYRGLSYKRPYFSIKVAMVLNNLSELYQNAIPDKELSLRYAREAIDILGKCNLNEFHKKYVFGKKNLNKLFKNDSFDKEQLEKANRIIEKWDNSDRGN